MELSGFSGWLTTLVFLPLVGGIAIALFVRGDRNARLAAAGIAVTEFALSVVIFAIYFTRRNEGGVQLVDKVENWIPIASLKAEYFLGVDGLSAPMVLLTGIVMFTGVLISWTITDRNKDFFVLYFMLLSGVFGVFASMWKRAPLAMMLIFLIAPAATMALSILSFMLVPREKVRLFGNRDAFVIAVAANQDFDHVRNAAMFHRSSFAHGVLDGRINAQVQRRNLRFSHAVHCIVDVA